MKHYVRTQDGSTFVFESKEDFDQVLGRFDEDGVPAELRGREGDRITVHFIASAAAEWSGE